jgi:hypothetical protein
MCAAQYRARGIILQACKEFTAAGLDATLVLGPYPPDFSTEAINSALIMQSYLRGLSRDCVVRRETRRRLKTKNENKK